MHKAQILGAAVRAQSEKVGRREFPLSPEMVARMLLEIAEQIETLNEPVADVWWRHGAIDVSPAQEAR